MIGEACQRGETDLAVSILAEHPGESRLVVVREMAERGNADFGFCRIETWFTFEQLAQHGPTLLTKGCTGGGSVSRRP